MKIRQPNNMHVEIRGNSEKKRHRAEALRAILETWGASSVPADEDYIRELRKRISASTRRSNGQY